MSDQELNSSRNWPALARREGKHRQERGRYMKHRTEARASSLRGGWTEADDFGAENISNNKPVNLNRDTANQLQNKMTNQATNTPHWGLFTGWPSLQSDDSHNYQMWHPGEFPQEIDTPRNCFESEEDIDWSHVLPNQKVIEEVQARSFDCEISMGPSIRMKIVSHIRENCERASNGSYKVGSFVRCDVDSTEKDPFRRCRFYLPDIWNYNDEMTELRNTIDSTFGSSSVNGETMEIAVPECNYSVIIKQGGDCELLWNDESFSALIDVNCTEDIDKFCRNTFKGVISVCSLESSCEEFFYFNSFFQVNRLSRLEKLQCHKVFRTPLFECLVRVTFGSREQCRDAIMMCQANRIARPFPKFLLDGTEIWNSSDTSSISFILKWYRRPSKGRATLIMELNCIPEDLQEDCELEWYLRHVLSLNGIEMENVSIHRYHHKERCNIVEIINRRLIIASIDSRVWNRLVPLKRNEWALVLSGELPWKVQVHPEQPDSEVQQASVLFMDVSMGLAIANNLLPLTPRPDVFVINSLDKLGVRILPKYRISLPITREVRVACDFIIRFVNYTFINYSEWDESERQASDMYDCCDWVRLVDMMWDNKTRTGYIYIEGWPVSYV
uniref:Tudor domain-containing protein n=1 Tax=Heterorhabditis bacteriophora TaxID=37862 RepID=A0A1I7WRV8_HETBA